MSEYEGTIDSAVPVLRVASVARSMAWYVDVLGFSPDPVGPPDNPFFAILRRDGVEIMYQTRASVIEDHPGSAGELDGHSIVLFITVDSLDEVEKALAGAPVVKHRHDTFYGSTEIYVREPGENTVGFAQMGTA